MLISLSTVIIPLLIINSIIFFFVNLVELFNILIQLDNQVMLLLIHSVKIMHVVLLTYYFVLLKRLLYIKVTLWYLLFMYNMNKYFIEYPKQRLFVCYDGKYSYLNLLINHCDNEYIFVQFVYGNIKICDAVRKVLKLRTKGDALYLATCMILDQFFLD